MLHIKKGNYLLTRVLHKAIICQCCVYSLLHCPRMSVYTAFKPTFKPTHLSVAGVRLRFNPTFVRWPETQMNANFALCGLDV